MKSFKSVRFRIGRERFWKEAHGKVSIIKQNTNFKGGGVSHVYIRNK